MLHSASEAGHYGKANYIIMQWYFCELMEYKKKKELLVAIPVPIPC